MADIAFTNNAESTLASPILSSDTTITVAAGEGALFPSTTGGDYFYTTIVNGSTYEVVKVTSRSGDVFTVVRGQDSTPAIGWASGTKISHRVNAATLAQLRDAYKVPQFVVLTTDTQLQNERVLTAGTGVSIVDSGPGSAVTISATGISDGKYLAGESITSGNLVALRPDGKVYHVRKALETGTFIPNTSYTSCITGATRAYFIAPNSGTTLRYFDYTSASTGTLTISGTPTFPKQYSIGESDGSFYMARYVSGSTGTYKIYKYDSSGTQLAVSAATLGAGGTVNIVCITRAFDQTKFFVFSNEDTAARAYVLNSDLTTAYSESLGTSVSTTIPSNFSKYTSGGTNFYFSPISTAINSGWAYITDSGSALTISSTTGSSIDFVKNNYNDPTIVFSTGILITPTTASGLYKYVGSTANIVYSKPVNPFDTSLRPYTGVGLNCLGSYTFAEAEGVVHTGGPITYEQAKDISQTVSASYYLRPTTGWSIPFSSTPLMTNASSDVKYLALNIVDTTAISTGAKFRIFQYDSILLGVATANASTGAKVDIAPAGVGRMSDSIVVDDAPDYVYVMAGRQVRQLSSGYFRIY